jgi:hypothetical protein
LHRGATVHLDITVVAARFSETTEAALHRSSQLKNKKYAVSCSNSNTKFIPAVFEPLKFVLLLILRLKQLSKDLMVPWSFLCLSITGRLGFLLFSLKEMDNSYIVAWMLFSVIISAHQQHLIVHF